MYPALSEFRKAKATAANDDGRLPFTDKGTRVVVFGNTADQASDVAVEIAKRRLAPGIAATLAEPWPTWWRAASSIIRRSRSARTRSSLPRPSCTAAVAPAAIDGGSFDARQRATRWRCRLDPADAAGARPAHCFTGGDRQSRRVEDSHGSCDDCRSERPGHRAGTLAA